MRFDPFSFRMTLRSRLKLELLGLAEALAEIRTGMGYLCWPWNYGNAAILLYNPTRRALPSLRKDTTGGEISAAPSNDCDRLVRIPSTLPRLYSALSSEELIVTCASNPNEDAWAEFVRRFRRLIFSIARRYVPSTSNNPLSEVEDLAQLAFLKCCKKNVLSSYNPLQGVRAEAFIWRICENALRDHNRTKAAIIRGPGVSHAELDAPDGQQPPATMGSPVQIEGQILLREIMEILGSELSDKMRERDLEIFRKRFVEGLTAQEIARSLPDLSVKGVESTISRMREMILNRMLPGGRPE